MALAQLVDLGNGFGLEALSCLRCVLLEKLADLGLCKCAYREGFRGDIKRRSRAEPGERASIFLT